jgi:hypothetical protein
LHGNARAYNKGGMHVHISRSAFQDDNHLHRFLYFLHEFKDFSVFIAQRNSERWASWYDKEDLYKFKINTTYNINNDRYMSVNFENYETIEIRIFNANIIANRNYKNIEFLHSVIEFTRNYKNPFTFYDYWQFVNNHKETYNNLLEFCNRKKFDRIFENLKEKTIKLPENITIISEYEKLLKRIESLDELTKNAWKAFFRWAENHNILDIWIKNLNNIRKPSEFNEIINEPINAINFAFIWRATPQGWNFWSDKNEEWENHYFKIFKN